jgi:RNA polymerase sigma-70 factor (sigma-E family)
MDGQRDFEDWAGAHWGVLVRTAVFLGCSVHEAQDLAQTTLEKCWSHWPRVRRADDRAAYVYRVLVNSLRDSRRRRSSTEVPREAMPEAGGLDRTEAVALAASVHQALAALDRDHREVVVLRYFVDLSERQTAEVLRVAPGTVKSRLSRALARLALDPDLADLRGGSR